MIFRSKHLHLILLCVLLLVLLCSPIVHADDGGQSATINELLQSTTAVFQLLRSIVVPFMILSIASYGIELFEAAYIQGRGKSVDEIKKKALYMILAAGLLCAIPTYISWTASISAPFSWQPPEAGEMDGEGLQYYKDTYGTEADSEIWFDHDDSSYYGGGFGNSGTHSNSGGKVNTSNTYMMSNADMARAAVSYAWPNFEDSKNSKGTSLYQYLHDQILTCDPAKKNKEAWELGITAEGIDRYYMACDRAVVVAVKWSGADDNIPWGDPVIMHYYFVRHSDEMNIPEEDRKWDRVYSMNNWNANKIDELLQPGDLLVSPLSTNDHILMYVGNDIIREIYGDELIDSLPNGSKLNCVEGSLNSRSAGLIPYWYGSEYNVWRCIKYEENSIYKDAHLGYTGPTPDTEGG